MVLSAWLSEELVRAAAFQGGVPGEGLPPPQSDTAKDSGPRSQGRACTGSAGGWDTDHQGRPGAGALGSPSSSRKWREPCSGRNPELGLFPYQKLRMGRGGGAEVEVPAHSGHTNSPRPYFPVYPGQHISTQRPPLRAQSLGAPSRLRCALSGPLFPLHRRRSPSTACLGSRPPATLAGRVRGLLWPSRPPQPSCSAQLLLPHFVL